MRIKIKGEITAERLAEALHAAAEKYEAVRPGHKVYGANLYLTAFDADGLPFDLADHRGEPLSITIEAKSGELVKPALTAEGEARRQKAKEGLYAGIPEISVSPAPVPPRAHPGR
ncbi:hypothetical protein [Pseudomonas aeruginosa]|uniref:hypothetical protein n=1 Tax=Pseudomonas aeruginosa TaxID=287 RepID=UPI0021C99A33|nr:hypothetical protein [Pseudomonas aeruginosa]